MYKEIIIFAQGTHVVKYFAYTRTLYKILSKILTRKFMFLNIYALSQRYQWFDVFNFFYRRQTKRHFQIYRKALYCEVHWKMQVLYHLIGIKLNRSAFISHKINLLEIGIIYIFPHCDKTVNLTSATIKRLFLLTQCAINLQTFLFLIRCLAMINLLNNIRQYTHL